MIVEYIRYVIKNHPTDSHEETFTSFEMAYLEAAKSLDATPHCLAYELTRCVEEPWRYTLRIEWDSIEGHLQGFRRSSAFGPFFAAIKGYVGEIEEMRHYLVTGITGRK